MIKINILLEKISLCHSHSRLLSNIVISSRSEKVRDAKRIYTPCGVQGCCHARRFQNIVLTSKLIKDRYWFCKGNKCFRNLCSFNYEF